MNKERTEEDNQGEDRGDSGNNTDEETGEDVDDLDLDYIY